MRGLWDSGLMHVRAGETSLDELQRVVEVPSDAEGVLQDTHWGGGQIGYLISDDPMAWDKDTYAGVMFPNQSVFFGAGTVLLTYVAGTGAVATGIVLGLQAQGLSRDFHALPQTDPGAPGVASRGRTFAIAGDLAVLAGAIAGGAGGWFLFADDGAAK